MTDLSERDAFSLRKLRWQVLGFLCRGKREKPPHQLAYIVLGLVFFLQTRMFAFRVTTVSSWVQSALNLFAVIVDRDETWTSQLTKLTESIGNASTPHARDKAEMMLWKSTDGVYHKRTNSMKTQPCCLIVLGCSL